MPFADVDNPDNSLSSESLSHGSDHVLKETVRRGTPAVSATRGSLLKPGEVVGRSLGAQPAADRTHGTPTVSNEEKRKLVPRDSAGELLSYGSRLHAEGKCDPCLFHRSGRCVTKELCEFCHYPHAGKKKKKPAVDEENIVQI